MLDDNNVLRQRDPSGALAVAAEQYKQTQFPITILNPEHDDRVIDRIVVAGMGGSALAALLVKSWLGAKLSMPFEVVRTYDLPAYVNEQTLVIASSHSGNTEETISALEQASSVGAQLAIITSGGKLKAMAEQGAIAHALIPADLQPRMAVIYNLRALLKALAHFGIIGEEYFNEIGDSANWLHEETSQWEAGVSVHENYAKQLALIAVGKTPVIYAGSLMFPAAYKWKISWNENAKNVAFCNEIPEFNHNEFIGWSSHPVEKPFVIFDLISSLEHPRILKRFEITDRLLSGMRPKANVVQLKGDSIIKQLLWAGILADFVSIYVAILNGVNPTPVELVEKLKRELSL